MTLDDLRAQFEAARDDEADKWSVAWLDPSDPAYDFRRSMVGAIQNIEPDDLADAIEDGWIDLDAEMIVEGRRYIIARDFNVFDPDRADMLWKLQHD